MKNFNFYHITDTHIYAKDEIGSYGKYFDFRCDTDQKCVAESGAIVDSCFRMVSEDKYNEIVLISGDLTYNGEIESHKLMRKKMKKLQKAGKRVFITFATHDFNNNARKYDYNGFVDLEKMSREELRKFYNDFGYSEAISEHIPSYSYCVQLTADCRLLALNDDGNAEDFCGYYDDLLEWIKEQTEKAHADGCEVIAMTHHPILPPSPIYPIFSHRDMLGGFETTGPFLADLGIEYLFVGHTHIQDINSLTTEKGNTMYQINTGALTAYPVPFRKIEVQPDGLDIKTINVDTIKWDMHGKSLMEYSKDHFMYLLKDIFYSMQYDNEHFALLATGFSMDAKTCHRLKPILKILGKVVNGMTFKQFGRLMMIGKNIDSSIENYVVKDFLLEVIGNMFSGHENFSPETAQYKAFIPACEKIGKLLKLKDHDGKTVDFAKLMAGTIYDSGIDDTDAFLPSSKMAQKIEK